MKYENTLEPNVTVGISEITNFDCARLIKAKNEIGVVVKDKKNPFFKSNYADINGMLAVVEPALLKHNFLLLQPIENDCVTSKIVDATNNEFIYSSIDLPKYDKPQELGSAITYFRRYTLQSLLALSAEDDDGNAASRPVRKNKKQDDLPEYIPSGLAGQAGLYASTDKDVTQTVSVGDEIIKIGEWEGKKVSEVCDLVNFIPRVEYYLRGVKPGDWAEENKKRYRRWIKFAKGK